jgi:AAA+ superfamily predicted ATPase
MSLTSFLSRDTSAAAVPLENEEVDIGDERPVRCLRNALWLISVDGTKAAILQSLAPGFRDQPKISIDVAVENGDGGDDFTRRFFQSLEHAVQQAVSYRGKVLSLEDAEGYTGESAGITVHALPEVTREEVILPAETLAMLERNITRFVRQRDALAERGQSTKKGVLFHGPPGNGKTHTIRYILSELKGHTALLISAEQVTKLAEYMALARLLQPTIVVLEDVDLVARQREASGPCAETLLNRLLNEMDGLKEDTQTIFLLTTNRPQQLEEALASRPGRVDQVIEFPPPDGDGRAKLVKLYSPGIQVSDQLISLIVQRTDGSSAAFIKELMRRALQYSLDRNDGNAIEAEDVQSALEELVIGGGELNRCVLGFHPGNARCDAQ